MKDPKQAGTDPPARNPARRTKRDDDPVVQVRIISTDEEAFTAFVQTVPIEFACAGPRINRDGVIVADALMRTSEVERKRRSRIVKVEVVADITAASGDRRAEVGRGNRFADPRELPVGRGTLIGGDR